MVTDSKQFDVLTIDIISDRLLWNRHWLWNRLRVLVGVTYAIDNFVRKPQEFI